MTRSAEDMSIAGAEFLRNEIDNHTGRKVSSVNIRTIAVLGNQRHRLPCFEMEFGGYNYYVYVEFDDPR